MIGAAIFALMIFIFAEEKWFLKKDNLPTTLKHCGGNFGAKKFKSKALSIIHQVASGDWTESMGFKIWLENKMVKENKKMSFNATWSMAVGGMVGGGIFSVLGVINY